ncbi:MULTISPECIES: RdgB/HAM1 family non-canonical purine NTP pyrophosphatase [unclassified Undibacterium]|uniref:RdgB/HAM1 family non-canonical purine NTP pyrophosphatase n=1 Tax=unclassified Undibacterium TaxID=2630295 RepID=UPI002AC9BC9C|nr:MULTISPECIES: RdgB/HAM1 family non-canonical purine NTP pyrophosphatase [unclassified Undibacterium]MEB0139825.1 RdgB/HAM1 family non-canonical purine NTP pyrophosphatase [Undibacterium sp. CCC2.1]MEB0172755.1 RdgB/HAM1 family non-canonical purine NTP pyrophosphatase [Undibacterium sp. CCC1.1]MEB0176547.1 RdgB/HAM1 family non-canonical purine NTP pyrophosphatase [Undibacterium sp. CCC3.4]MEB0215863.1 RdgB/HAM1 family non-canonical purine NTP pyrophosphatase [Undibacterium sp. 5I2]WPX42713.1
MTKEIVLASNNAGKLREFYQILAPLGIELRAQAELGVAETDEPYFTFVENALRKARHAAAETGLPALADDSGICVPALGGAPGVLSARFGGAPKSDQRNNAALLSAMAAHADKSAYYYCVLVLVRSEHDPQPLIADGLWHGRLIDTARGSNGFGYDPHFYLPDLGKTVAELDAAEKNQRSHRAQALRVLFEKLK